MCMGFLITAYDYFIIFLLFEFLCFFNVFFFNFIL
jgi:hypothetical protein